MKPTQKEEDGKRTNAADDDDFQKCMFQKYANKGLLTREDALGATQEIISTWAHLNAAQTNEYLSGRFDKAFDHFDILHNGAVAFNEMYELIKMVQKD